MIVVNLMMLAGAIFLSKKLLDDIAHLRARLQRARILFDRFTNQAVKVKGRVLKTGYNLDYDFPGLSPEDILGRELTENEIETFEKKRQEKRLSKADYGNVHFHYGYEFNGNRIVGRSVNFYGTKRDLEYFYKYKKGDAITVYVDPKDPLVSALELPDENDHDGVVWDVIMGLAPRAVIAVLAWLIVLGVLYSQF